MANERQRNQILGLLFFGVLMAALDIAIVGPALPAIQNVFAPMSEHCRGSSRSMCWGT